MSFKWNGYVFEGSLDLNEVTAGAGVYIIFCKSGDAWKVLDIGESQEVRKRLANHDRKDCWNENCAGKLYYSAHSMPGSSEDARRTVESDLRSKNNTPCGEK